MSFETDKQTMKDLTLLGKFKNNSIYNLFTDTVTRGGELLIEDMFMHPLSDLSAINDRVAVFSVFKAHDWEFPFGKEEFDVVQQYIERSAGNQTFAHAMQLVRARCMFYINHDPEYDLICEDVKTCIGFFKKARTYLGKLMEAGGTSAFWKEVGEIRSLLDNEKFVRFLETADNDENGLFSLLKKDRGLRGTFHRACVSAVKLLQRIDAYVVIGKVAREKHFCFAEAVEDPDLIVSIKGMHHPRLDGAVSNDIEVTRNRNIFFLTGANMAGKSTLMKSFGISVYMAHMGFPIAAASMRFIVLDGIYTSINVPDNINLGYSHFYAEVLRVKKVAIEISRNKRLLVIFDELFKGTNVKDAFDATLAVTKAIIERKNCAFMVSTHIIEVGQELQKTCDNVNFEYLPTVMKGAIPTYTYKLKEGITNDKHGMIIINNEKIIQIIKGEVEC